MCQGRALCRVAADKIQRGEGGGVGRVERGERRRRGEGFKQLVKNRSRI